MQDRLALRQSCRALTASIPYGGLRLCFPMSRQQQQTVPSLADRPAICKLTFEQTCSGRIRKRAFKNLLSRLGPAVGRDRRCACTPVQLIISPIKSVLTVQMRVPCLANYYSHKICIKRTDAHFLSSW